MLEPAELEPGQGSRVLCVAASGPLIAAGHAHGTVSIFDTADTGSSGAPANGAKEMMQPCLIHLRLISLVAPHTVASPAARSWAFLSVSERF